MTLIGSSSAAATRFSRSLEYGQKIRVRPVSQVLLSCSTDAAEDVARDARRMALRWIQDKAGRNLPSAAWDGEPFNLDYVGAQRAEATRVNGYWAARADDQDKEVIGRTWVTEIVIFCRKQPSSVRHTPLYRNPWRNSSVHTLLA